MRRLVQAFGFTPMAPEKARANAPNRRKLRYRGLSPEFADKP